MFGTLLFPTPLTSNMNHVTHSITHDLLRSMNPGLFGGNGGGKLFIMGVEKEIIQEGHGGNLFII